MLKIQSVNHVSEHLSAIYPVYTAEGVMTLHPLLRGVRERSDRGGGVDL